MTATARDITLRIDAEALVYNIVANLLERSNEGRNSGILVTIAVFEQVGFYENMISCRVYKRSARHASKNSTKPCIIMQPLQKQQKGY